MTKSLLSLFLLFAVLHSIECGNILFWFSVGSKSHYNLMKPLAMALAKRDHTLTVVASQPYPALEAMGNVRYIKVDTDMAGELNSTDIFEGGDIDIREAIKLRSQNQEVLLANPGIQSLMKEPSKFDVIFISATFSNDLGLYLAKKHFKSPVIQFFVGHRVATVDLAMGNPINPSYIPLEFLGYSQTMTFKERLINTVVLGVLLTMMDHYLNPAMGKTLQELLHLEEAPDIAAMGYEADFAFVNNHEVFESVVPTNPNTAWIGGIHLGSSKTQPLPHDLKKFLDEAKDGAILVSYGSVLTGSHLPEHKRKILVDTFSKLKQRVIWKWETEVMEDKPANVMLKSWLPQQDILAHPNLKLFVNHGGLLSIEEALFHRVPVVVMPGFGDQFSNAARAERMGFGKELRWNKLDNDNLEETIETVISNHRYKEKAEYYGHIFSDNIVSSLDKAIFYTEYIMRHKGAPHLRSPVKDLYWFQYFLLDVFAFIIIVGLGILFILFKVIKLAVCFLCGKKKSTNKKVKNS